MRVNINSSTCNCINFDLEKVTHFIAPNSKGKTTFSRHLKEGFEGKLKNELIVDGNEVDKNEYFVYYIEDTSGFEIEAGLNAKSYLKKIVESEILSLEDNVISEIDHKFNEIRNIIENGLFDKLSIKDELNINFELAFELKSYLMKNLDIKYENVDISLLPLSKRRLMLIQMYLDIIKNINQKSILIIDEFCLGLSDHESELLLDTLSKSNTNLHIILFSSRRRFKNEYCLYYNNNVVVDKLYDDFELFKIKYHIDDIDNSDIIKLYTKEEIESVILDELEIQTLQDYFISDFKKEVCDFYKKILHTDFK